MVPLKTLYVMHLENSGTTVEFYREADRDEAVRLAEEAESSYTTWETVETLH